LFLPAFADTLYFKEKTSIDGIIENVDASGVHVKIPYGSTIFPEDKIEDIIFDEESKAIALTQKQFFSEATIEYERLLGLHSEDFKKIFFQYRLGLALTASSLLKKGIPIFIGLKEEKKFLFREKAFSSLSRIYLSQKEHLKAIDLWSELLSESPSAKFQDLALLERGTIFFQNDQEDKAKEDFSSLIKNFPASPSAKKAQKFLKEKTKNNQEEVEIQHLFEETEKIRKLPWNSSNTLLFQKIELSAQKLWNSSLTLENQKKILPLLWENCLEQATYDRAEIWLEKYLRLSIDQKMPPWETLLILGRDFEKKGLVSFAIQVFVFIEIHSEEHSNHFSFLVELAELFIEGKNFEKALDIYFSILETMDLEKNHSLLIKEKIVTALYEYRHSSPFKAHMRSAILVLEKLTKRTRDAYLQSVLKYYQGIGFLRLSEYKKSKTCFQEVRRNYPFSEYSLLSLKFLKELKEKEALS
jgi:tetratricopeptide (TPR) repeat protein